MHCPKCGEQQISEETRFCSRCGFLLVGVSEVVANGGIIPNASPARPRFGPTQRNKGLKKGLFIVLLSFLLVPLVVILSVGTNAGPTPAVILAILLTVGGMLRMAYAMLFESNDAVGSPQLANSENMDSASFLGSQQKPNELPPHQSIPASAYVSPGTGAWLDTNELNEPGSVTDSTTKLLQKEDHH